MIIFGYEMEGGDRMPMADEVWRVFVTSDYRNNVLVWRGDDIDKYTLEGSTIFKIEEMILSDKELLKVKKMEESMRPAYDIPSYGFYFGDGQGGLNYVSGFMFYYKIGQNFPNTDKLVRLTLKVQRILNDNGIKMRLFGEDFFSVRS